MERKVATATGIELEEVDGWMAVACIDLTVIAAMEAMRDEEINSSRRPLDDEDADADRIGRRGWAKAGAEQRSETGQGGGRCIFVAI